MDAQAWAAAGGIGGLAIFAAMLTFRRIIAAQLLRQVNQKQTFIVIVLLMSFSFAMGIVGVAAYVYLHSHQAISRERTLTELDVALREINRMNEAKGVLMDALRRFEIAPSAERWAVVLGEMGRTNEAVSKAKGAIINYNAAFLTDPKRLDFRAMVGELNERDAELKKYLGQSPPTAIPTPELANRITAAHQQIVQRIASELEQIRWKIAAS